MSQDLRNYQRGTGAGITNPQFSRAFPLSLPVGVNSLPGYLSSAYLAPSNTERLVKSEHTLTFGHN
jgi:hypothetical protein